MLQSLLLPLSTLLICGCGIVVRILYSEPFVPAVPFICVAKNTGAAYAPAMTAPMVARETAVSRQIFGESPMP